MFCWIPWPALQSEAPAGAGGCLTAATLSSSAKKVWATWRFDRYYQFIQWTRQGVSSLARKNSNCKAVDLADDGGTREIIHKMIIKNDFEFTEARTTLVILKLFSHKHNNNNGLNDNGNIHTY